MPQDAMYFNVELPTDAVSAVIPVTLGCNSNFTVSQITTGDPGQQFPADFKPGKSSWPELVPSP